jgi:hypothetical protein
MRRADETRAGIVSRPPAFIASALQFPQRFVSPGKTE